MKFCQEFKDSCAILGVDKMNIKCIEICIEISKLFNEQTNRFKRRIELSLFNWLFVEKRNLNHIKFEVLEIQSLEISIRFKYKIRK